MSLESREPRGQDDWLEPGILPTAMRDFLGAHALACLAERTSLGTSYIIKAPKHEIDSVRGKLPIRLTHELHRLVTAPVLRTVIRLEDRPESALVFETFTNVDDADQRANFEALASQRQVFFHFYDEDLEHRLTKCVSVRDGSVVTELLQLAEAHRRLVPDSFFDFDSAKALVMSRTSL